MATAELFPDSIPLLRRGARELLADSQRSAVLSPCGRFRYWLSRRWAEGPVLLFVMLNPSTADASIDDATIRRCVTFANAHGFGALEVVNLFAFRATYPKDLRLAGWPPGPENDWHIGTAASRADAVCVAWGAIGEHHAATARMQVVMPLLRAAGAIPQCLRVTRSGYPQHPLMLASSCRLMAFDEAAIDAAMEK